MQRAAIPRLARMMRSDRFDAVSRQLGVESIAVVGLVADESLRKRLYDAVTSTTTSSSCEGSDQAT
jgi:hypothetical protein